MAQNNTQKSVIKFVVPAELKTDLAQLARVRNISLSALLRLVLTEYVKHKG